jgi:hypothetical protein
MAARARKTVDERFYLSSTKGGGMIRREVWIDERGRVARYNLAYINYRIFTGDNGRVLGYDSAHGYHHRHYLGKVAPAALRNFMRLMPASGRNGAG